MEKSQVKPNDIFVATFGAPDATTFDFLKNGINAENTSLYSKEDYMKTPFVKKRFTDSKGVFRQDEFDKMYEKAYQNFEQLADENAFQGLKEYLTWGKDSMYRSPNSELQDTDYKGETFKNNPLQQSIGLSGLNRKSDPKLTEEEAAQSNKVWDSENKKWLDHSAEDQGFLKKAFGETLVYAKYDKDGMQVNPVTGEEGYHKKGEWITDENGNYFTETLGNRQLLDKQVVQLSDILTKEGSTLNKFDFWDSDGYDKSVAGIAAKTVAHILPYLTPIRGYYGAFTMAMQIAATMPVLYKSLESIALGENQSGLTPTMTSMENWFAKWNGSKSRKGQEGFWNLENVGELIADTFGQMYQQRAAAAFAPKVLSKFDSDIAKAAKYQNLMQAGKVEEALALGDVADSIKKLNNISSGLVFTYTGLTQGAEMYNESLNAGYDRRTAGLVSLATMGSLFGIMKFNEGKNGLGTWFLDRTTGYSQDIDRGIVAKAAKEELNILRNEIQKAVTSGDRNKVAYALKEWKRKGASKLHDAFVIGGEDLWKGFLVEGVEEVTEEATQDFVKGLTDTMSWLGWTAKEGSFGGWDNVFSKEGMSRYLSTFIGGGLGGSLFAAQNKWINPAIDSLFGMNNGRPDSNQQRENYEIAKIILDGRFDEYIKELDKCKKFVKNSLDSTLIENPGAEKDGEKYYNISSNGESQADLVVKLAKEKAITMKNLLQGAVGNFDSLGDFEKRWIASKFASVYGSDGFNFDKDYLNAQFTKAAGEILTAKETLANFNKEAKDMSDEEEVQKKEAQKALEKAVDNFKNFFDAKHFVQYSIDGALLARPELIKSLINTSLEDYSRNVHGKDITKITDQKLKDKITEEWDSLKEGLTKENMTEVIPKIRKLYMSIFNSISPELQGFTDGAQAGELIKYIHQLNANPDAIRDELISILSKKIDQDDPQSQQKYNELIQQIRDNGFTQNLLMLAKIKPEFLSIGPRHDFDLYSAIKPALTLEANGNVITPAQEKLIQQLINEQASRSSIDIWTPEHIQEFINSIQSILDDETNVYSRRLLEQRIEDIPEDQRGTFVLNPIELKLDVNKLSDDIRSIKINSLKDFANQFTEIDSELKEHLAGMYFKDAVDRIEKSIILEDPTDPETAAPGVIKELPEYKQIVSSSDSNIRKLQKLVDLRNRGLNSQDMMEADEWNSLFPDTWVSEVTELLNKTAVENKIVTALKKLYVGVHGNNNGKNIFDFLADKSKTISTWDGLNKELTLSDHSIIQSAAKSLDLIMAVVDASVGTKLGIDPITGLNTRVEGGIIDFGKQFLEMSGEDSSAYKAITDTGAKLTKDYINDLRNRLDQLAWFNRSLGVFKNKLDEETRKQYTIGFAQDILSREIKIRNHVTISPISQDQIPEDEINCEKLSEIRMQEIANQFQALLQDQDFKAAASTLGLTPKQYLIDCILENFGDQDLINPIQKANDLCTWDEKTKSGESNQYWIAKRLIQQIIVGRDEIQKDIRDILSKNNQIYPKFDQMLVMEDMLYEAYDIKSNESIINYFNSKVNERNKKVLKQKDRLIPLNNTISILGGPGSGKTFLLQICKDKLKEILGPKSEFKVSAMSVKKTEDLKSDLNAEGKVVKDLIEDIQQGLGDKCDVIDNAVATITKRWNEEFAQKHKDSDNSKQADKTYQDELQAFVDSIPGATKIEDPQGSGQIIGMTVKLDEVNGSTTITKAQANFYFYSEKEENGVINRSLFATLTPEFTVYPNLDGINIDFNLMIDESTMVHPSYLAILSKLAEKSGKMLIISGDKDQQGYLVDSGDQKASLAYYELFFPNSSPMLISSYRFNSNLKTGNISKIASEVERWRNKYGYGINSSLDINPQTLIHLKEELEKNLLDWQVLRQGNNAGRFIGDKIISERTVFEQDLVNYIIPEINSGKSLAVVYEDTAGRDEIKSYLESKGVKTDNIQFLDAADIQGGEFDYIISYKLKKSSSNFDFDLDFDVAKAYTILSRSRFGTLVLDESDGLFKNCGIQSTDQESKDGLIFESDDSAANQKRIARVDELINILGQIPTIATQSSEDTTDTQSNIVALNPISGIDPQEDEPDEEKDKSGKIKSTVKKVFNDASILQAWYTRLGINWKDNYEEKCSKVFGPTRPDGNLSDLEAYYWGKLYTEEGKMDQRYPNKSIADLAQEFLSEKNEMVYRATHDGGEGFRYRYWCKDREDKIDDPYAKLNDDGSAGKTLQLIQVWDTNIKGWITIGKLGYNKDSNDDVMSETQARYATVNTSFEFEFDPNKVKNQDTNVDNYLSGRSYKDKNKSNFGFVQYTTLRNYLFDPVITESQKLPTSGKVKFYDEKQSKYSRLTFGNLLSLGYEIYPDGGHWDPKKSVDFGSFKDWYSKFRPFEPITDWEPFKGLEKRVWIVMRQKGTNNIIPVLVNKIQENYSQNLPTVDNNTDGNVRGFGYTQIARALKYLVKQSNLDGKEDILEEMQNYDKSKKLSEAIKILELILDKGNINKIVPEIANALGINQDTLKGELKTFNQYCIDHQSSVDSMATGEKGINFHKRADFDKLLFIKAMDTNLEGFFFTADTNDVVTQIGLMGQSPNEYVVSRFFETPRYFLLWDAITPISNDNSSNTPALDHDQVLGELQKLTGLHNEMDILKYAQLLYPGIKKIENLYDSQNRDNIIREIVDLISDIEMMSILDEDISNMANEQSIRDYKAKLIRLRAKQKNENLIKFIDDLTAACDAQLEKLKPKTLKTLDDLRTISPVLAKVIKFYEENRQSGIMTTQELFDQFSGLSKEVESEELNTKENKFRGLTAKDIDPTAKAKIREILNLLKSNGIGYKVSGMNMDKTSAEDLKQMKLLYMATKC